MNRRLLAGCVALLVVGTTTFMMGAVAIDGAGLANDAHETLVAVAVTALASTWTATAAPEDNSTQQPTHHAVPPSCTAKSFHAFSANV